MQTLNVELGERSYPIFVGAGLLAQLDKLLDSFSGSQVAVFTNPTVRALYGDALLSALGQRQVDVFEMPDGEQYKSLATYQAAMDFLMHKRHNRTTTLLALGGGVVGDLTGFVAATFQRGVNFVQIPTTLLAQVDSSVGGKTAVNHPAGKNMIGAFYQPQAVFADIETLRTLPPREYAAGLAEVAKYGVIADAEFFDWLESNVDAVMQKDAAALEHMVHRSCEIKAEVVAADERETGVRAILNFGHTFGHALEKITQYKVLLHGEAVAVGMLIAADFSHALGLCGEDVQERLLALLPQLGLPTGVPEGVEPEAMRDAMGMDKKVVDGQVRFIVAQTMGHAQLIDEFPATALDTVLDKYC